MNPIIKVRTINQKHVDQLPYTHNWDGTYPWPQKTILGRLSFDGFILVQDKTTKELERVSPVAYQDYMLEKLGCRKMVNGKWEYAPTPHTEFYRKAAEVYKAIPQLFVD